MALSHEEFSRLANEGGASRSFKTGDAPVGPGVMVSIPDAEKITNAPTTPKEVAEFHAEHAARAGEDHYQGAWRSGDLMFHDVSKKEPTIQESRHAGVLGKQISGYDLGNTDIRRPEGGLIYYGRDVKGIESDPEFKGSKYATSIPERMSPKPKAQEFAEQSHISRSATRRNKAGRQVPVSINEVYATIAKNRRNRGV